MLPIRDDTPRSTTPYINYFLIVLNLLIFYFEWTLSPRSLRSFEYQFAFVPLNITGWVSGSVPASVALVPFISSMFLHANWWHVIGNMWFLRIFGDNVEDRLGHFGYLIFYLLCGVGADLAHLVFNFNSRLPAVGASGAIAGVMGAYFVLYPRARVLTWWIFFVFWLPAWLVLGYWFLGEFLGGAASLFTSSGGAGGVAFWAHVGGFVTGVVLIKLLPTKKNVYAFEEY
ncbi:MAG TPA: rhomboid family intramembrane serine protease [Candidatus Angelobacter sp.]|nr:rhomboid family intramembrane serine protease [Candidatus Angelobacter sp.]